MSTQPPHSKRSPRGLRRWSRVAAAVVALTTGMLPVAGCSERPEPAATPERPGDVLLLTVDTLRPDHLGLYGYARPTTPNLDRIFADGLVVERAYSTEANTSPAVASILTGLLPQEHGVRLLYQLLPEDVVLLPQLLPDAYQSAAFVANVVLTDEAMGMASRFDHFDDFLEQDAGHGGVHVYERDARRTTDAALRWLQTERDPARPLFLWVHYIDPHAPYRAPEPSHPPFEHADPVPLDPERAPGLVRLGGPRDALVYVDRYDEEIVFTDREIGRLVDGYARRWPLEDALLVFTADHGESMMEHELWFAHGYHVYDEVVRVPLLLRGPGLPRGRVRGPASVVDVVPTILSFAGAPRPAHLSGIDWTRPPDDLHERTVYAEATALQTVFPAPEDADVVGSWRAAVRGEEKWMAGVAHGRSEVLERRYYDLRRDPDELAPRPAREEAGPESPAAALDELVAADPDPGGVPEQLRKGIQLDAPKVAPRASDAQRERLRALGYVE